ncbi:MAG TPA: DPP IV N-terminal domain-containing protein, partial [Chitinophagaceae bacterium]
MQKLFLRSACFLIVFCSNTGIFSANAQPLQNAWSYQSLQFDHPYHPDLTSFRGIKWNAEGHDFTKLEKGENGIEINEYDPAQSFDKTVIATAADLTPSGNASPLQVEDYTWYPQHQQLMIFTNSKRVWRAHTRGDFWVYEAVAKKLIQLGKGLPESSLQFAKISPDGTKAAFVSGHNIYLEDLANGNIKQLTTDGTEKIINGTFDWAYEEELFCRDGFRWSPDSRSIAYWQINATGIRDFLMINNTDSIYSFTIPVQYPKVGYDPSSARIGVVDIATAATKWMDIPGDPVQHYLPRMDWAGNNKALMVQQFNRKQDTSVLYLVNVQTGRAKAIYSEGDSAWIDINYFWQYDRPGWDWINDGEFLWTTEKDGWKHVFRLNRDGSHERLITNGNYDVMDIMGIDRKQGLLYFTASPGNATRQYLYSVPLDGKGGMKMVSPENEKGTHRYNISPDGEYAVHNFSNHDTPPLSEFVRISDNRVLKAGESYHLS